MWQIQFCLTTCITTVFGKFTSTHIGTQQCVLNAYIDLILASRRRCH